MTARQPGPNAQFSALLSRFPPEIVALVKRCLPKLRRAVACSYQLVYDYSNSVVVAFGMSERGYEAIVAIAVFPRSVRLYFDKSLPDPNGRLEAPAPKCAASPSRPHQTSITRTSGHSSRLRSSTRGSPSRRPARPAWS